MFVKKLFFLILMFSVPSKPIEYIDGQVVTLYRVLSGSHVVKLGIDPYSSGSLKENEIRAYGIHNMQIIVKGCEPVNLVKDDVCHYPMLFTLLARVASVHNSIVQRWACVKYFHPLSFAFKVESGCLKISSSLYQWKFLAPCLTEQIVPLRATEKDFEQNNNRSAMVVIVNDKRIELLYDQIVMLYKS